MTKRRSPGDGGLHWDEERQRWIASLTVGYTPKGKRIVKKASGKTKTEAKARLKQIIRDWEEGLLVSSAGYTVANAVENWLLFGLSGRDSATVEKCKILGQKHVIACLGARKLAELSADEVDTWLADRSKVLSTRSLREVRSILLRAVNRAQARDKVKRNVVLLCEIPKGRPGRPSKSLTFNQAEAVLDAADGTLLNAYIVLSLLIGARTEELRALTWSHVALKGEPASIMVWRSVRAGGDTKTQMSRRTLAMPKRCAEALKAHQERQAVARKAAGKRWQENDLVFASTVGTQLDSHNVRRAFRKVLKKAGLNEKEWTPREMRHSFVSLLSDSGVPIENISRLVGHSNTKVTELVYRKQLRPMLLEGAEAMDDIFKA
ncbi:tyrosine-type recombinase/integrase [Herbidospora daliensis]|uniref:tyrosine-type recombinase/integrase n=1 Tax=Herbidospora daliensis TaxID=295585 RepID=UPI0007849A71|nr:site-specific integrase [Herbidospora daliensis]